MSPTTCRPQHILYVLESDDDDSPLAAMDAEDDESSLDDDDHAYTQTTKLTCTVGGTSVAMKRLLRGRRGMHTIQDRIHHDTWDRVLCEGVPISLRELVSLAAVHLRLPDTLQTHKRLLLCSWTLGYHVTSTDSSGYSTHFWGGGVTPNTTSPLKRGDWVEIEGSEMCRGLRTSRLGRIICGVRIRKLGRVFGGEISDVVWENDSGKSKDYVVFLLVRYVMAHHDVGRQRGPEHRPLCPGPLKNTHCLWKWCQRGGNFRRGCWRDRPWARHKHMFGDSEEEQNKRKTQEARAWFDFIQSSNVGCHTNVKEDWDRPEALLQSVMWC